MQSCHAACLPGDGTRLRTWREVPFPDILCVEKKKKEEENHTPIFFENHFQSAGRYSVNFVLQRFVASYKFGSCPAINLRRELSLRPSGELEIKCERQDQECTDELEKLVTGFLDAG